MGSRHHQRCAVRGAVSYVSYPHAPDPSHPPLNDLEKEEDYCDEMEKPDDYDGISVSFDHSDNEFSDKTAETVWHEGVATGMAGAHCLSCRCNQRSGLRDDKLPFPGAIILFVVFIYMVMTTEFRPH